MADEKYVESYRGMEFELPLSDEDRAWLVSKSKDTVVTNFDKMWANYENVQRVLAEKAAAEEAEDAELEADGLNPENNGDGDDDTVEVPYPKWTNKELRAEIDDRNEARKAEDANAELLDVPAEKAPKAELIAVLEADDDE